MPSNPAATTFPYRDPALSVEQRVADLVSRMTLEDKAGLMFHDITLMGPAGEPMGEGNPFGRPSVARSIRELRMNHFALVGPVTDAGALARWHNALQREAEQTPLGIPVTVSTDPRHAFTSNVGTSAPAGVFSQWPEPLGLAALGDEALVRRFADIARQEYLAVGLRVGLQPQVDLATEPRWSRVAQTFGESAELTTRLGIAYVEGFRGGDRIGPESVSCVVKHFPGGGPQKDGEDPHFDYGKEQVYPAGMWEYHLAPFRALVAAGVTQVMPYYGMPIGTEYEEIAFGFNRGVLQGLLRRELGFDGVILSDFGILTDNHDLGQSLPARAWGVEHLAPAERLVLALDAGVDQFGGEFATGLLPRVVRSGAVSEERIDESVSRLLAEKFRLGLFEQPYVDEERAPTVVGNAAFAAEGAAAQRAAIVRLTEATTGTAALPVSTAPRIYTEGVGTDGAARLGTPVTEPGEADLALLRLEAPHEAYDGPFESLFHRGSLAFPEQELERILAICRTVPTMVVLHLDRAAVVPEIAEAAAALLVEFGASDDAVIDVLTGEAVARGRLPFDLPSSMVAVEASAPDAPFDTAEPLFRFGFGL